MTPGVCQHVAPSPGQGMCQCEHRRIELEMTIALLSKHIATLQERGDVFLVGDS